MSRNYDNWEKLAGAVLRREKDRQLAYCKSFSTSYSDDLSSRFSFDSAVVGDVHQLPPVSPSSRHKFDPTDPSSENVFLSRDVKAIEFEEIRKATKNFRRDLYLGEGGFGPVFKGRMGSGIAVAVKMLSDQGFEGHDEWVEEINYLSQLHHPNLVQLIGYSFYSSNRFLVYEFMPKGSLDNHLFAMRFTKKRGAGMQDAPQEIKRLRSASPVHEQQLVRIAPAATDLRPPTASPPSQKKTAAVIDISGGGEGTSGSPTRLGGLSLTEGVGEIVKWLEHESVKQEEEKSQYAEQLMTARAKLKKANTEVKALKADFAAQIARAAVEAEEAQAEMGRLKAELRAAKGKLKAANDWQGEVLREYTKRLLLSDHFTGLANDLAGLINGNAVLEALEEVAKDHPGLDASKYGYKRLEGAAEYTQYAKVVRGHLGRLPLLEELARSAELLTAEMVAACPTDRDADLDAAFDALPEEDVEMEEAGAGAEEERAGEEPSSSRGAESPGAAETGGAVEGISAGKQPTPAKEVGDP